MENNTNIPREITNLYAIYDNKAETIIGPVISEKHDAAAIRTYTDLLREPKVSLSQHPADYDLIGLGSIHNIAGEIAINPQTRLILSGAQWLATQNRDNNS